MICEIGGCISRQAAAQPHDYELAVLAQDRAAYDEKRKEARER